MLSRKVSLKDVDDVEAFVITCVKRSGCNAPSDRWEELIAEGILLLYVMAENYQDQMPGYEVAGRFSGYAIKWLPRQIGQYWHKSQENHLYVKDPETKRRGWTYRQGPVSWEALMSDDREHSSHERHVLPMSQWFDVPQMDST